MCKSLTVCIKGGIPAEYIDWFEDLDTRTTGDRTIITGIVPDKSAIHGIIERVRNLNLNLISVEVNDLSHQ